MMKLKSTLTLAVFFVSLCAQFAQAYIVRSSDPYYIIKKDNISYIYSAENRSALPELQHYMKFFIDKYNQSYLWRLDSNLPITLTSPRTQVANGFATVIPFLQTVHYTSGFELLDQFAEDSFLFALTSHETAHLYQLNVKSQMSSYIHTVLGNTPYVMTPIGVPIFVHPNIFLPNFLLEGNAVLNESLYGRGGRLWSGEIRASVLSQLKKNQIDPNRLINFHIDFPYSEKYYQGGYFAADLAKRHGVDGANRLFLANSDRDLWPFLLNKSFRQQYKKSYTRAIHDYVQEMKPLAEKQQWAKGTVLTRVWNRPKFNHDKNKIIFVGNQNFRGSNELFTLYKNGAQFTAEKTDIPMGKIFEVGNGRYYAADSLAVDGNNVKYGLFTNGLAYLPESLNRIYQDRRAGHDLYVAALSYDKNNLYRDNTLVGHPASSAVLDEKGAAYYFVQSGSERTLMKDQQAVFKYQGYYGIPTEVASDGTIFFIASTAYGSTLYKWQEARIQRVLAADNVVDARQISSDSFLVAAVTDQNFEIQTVKEESSTEAPYYQAWNLTQELPAFSNDKTASANAAFSEEESYSSWRELRYSSTNLFFAGEAGQFETIFLDPLYWTYFSIGGQYNEGPDRGGQLTYIYRRYRLGAILRGTYDEDREEEDVLKRDDRFKSSALLGADYLLFLRRRWSSNMILAPYWERDSLYPRNAEDRVGGLGYLDLVYTRRDGPYSYEPFRHFILRYTHRSEWLTEQRVKANSLNGIEGSIGGDIYKQTFLTATGNWAVGETNSIDIDLLKKVQDLSPFTRKFTFFPGQSNEVSEVRQWSVILKQAIDWRVQGPRFPVGLLRIAPKLTYLDTYTREFNRHLFPSNKREIGVGLEADLVFLHIFPVRVGAMSSSSEANGTRAQEWSVALSSQTSF